MAFIAAPVAAWALGAGASATVAAVAGSVAVGIVSGAVIGAASAAISGGDIFKGALKGAVVGGISGGILSGAGIVSGVASAETQLANYGVEGYGAANAGVSAPTTGAEVAAPGANEGILSSSQPVAQEAVKKGLSDETIKVIAGVGQGAAQGLGEVGAAKTEAESQKQLAEWEQEQERLNVAANVPGEFEAKVANIKIPEWWNTYLNPKKGILASEVA